MLYMQRASAGSGKTYTLARQFIWFLIAIRHEGEKVYKLRTPAELRDSLSHILAVTFTNKATNEMQMRIVRRLYELAYPSARFLSDTRPVKERDDVPEYMADFCRDLRIADPMRIVEACRQALAILLNHYSDFNVSTIDAFFQRVLRTFTYETGIKDSFQVELDGEYLSQLSIDSLLEDIDSGADEKDDTKTWVKVLMDRVESGKWNIFQDKSGENAPDKGAALQATDPYSSLLKSLGRLENEEYKEIRPELEEFLDTSPDFRSLYDELSVYESRGWALFRKMAGAIREIYDAVPDKTPGSRTAEGKALANLRKVLPGGPVKWNKIPDDRDIPLSESLFTPSEAVRGRMPALWDMFDEKLPAARALVYNWLSWISSPDFLLARLYLKNLPHLALFGALAMRRRRLLAEGNAVELGETSMILKTVIGQSDTPFIYERLGTYLNHFLIDEFQDTSRMQWNNIRHLLGESLSRGEDNLIIGDAKQSIYRFRNADPSLISSGVARDFPRSFHAVAVDAFTNTNHRSLPRVVRFNNSFFSYLADALTLPGRMDFRGLYGNVVQYIKERKPPLPTGRQGYVRIELFRKYQGFKPAVLQKLAPLVASLIARGYHQKDIAVLVDTNSEGEAVINEFVAYNATRGSAPAIEFVSEQSLKVASATSVRIVTGMLENIVRGAAPKIRTDEEERKKKGVGKWSEIEGNFRYYAAQDGRGDTSAMLSDFLATDTDFSRLEELLGSRQSTALPALVEGIVAAFVPEATRRREALFIAAFQDLVLEYCDGHPTDVGSFLRWWKRRSLTATIASPENTDAVQVMTIHKSKGLEFECVIVPFADWNFIDKADETKSEWRWVTPLPVKGVTAPFPPKVPLELTADVGRTPYAPLLNRYYDMRIMDCLNEAYVAFTRAGAELYVFAWAYEKKDAPGENRTVGSILENFVTSLRESDAPLEDTRLLEPEAVSGAAGSDVYEVGMPLPAIERKNESKEDSEEEADTGRRLIADYGSLLMPASLSYRVENLPDILDAEDYDVDDERNPRAEGTLKHAVLELVETVADLPGAVRRLELEGKISPDESAILTAGLIAKLRSPEVRRWFADGLKVINERTLLVRGVFRRPDRIVVFPDGHAEIVDYKFGVTPDSGDHIVQVQEYVGALYATGLYTRVEGFIWYVNRDKVIPAGSAGNPQ